MPGQRQVACRRLLMRHIRHRLHRTGCLKHKVALVDPATVICFGPCLGGDDLSLGASPQAADSRSRLVGLGEYGFQRDRVGAVEIDTPALRGARVVILESHAVRRTLDQKLQVSTIPHRAQIRRGLP